MKTTERFDRAVKKLYPAFHEGTLNAFDCWDCAVGNIVGHGNWAMHVLDRRYREEPKLLQTACNFKVPEHEDYSQHEIIKIEYVFLMEWFKAKSHDGKDKHIQFKGLCAVVEYLCELDSIENVMYYTKLFETEKGKPKYALK